MEKSDLTRLFDEGMGKAASLIDEARKKWETIDFDAIKKSIKDCANNFYDSALKFGGKIKNSFTDFKLTVPFDADTHRFNYKVEDGMLKLKIKNRNVSPEDEDSEIIEMTIPQSCIADKSKYFVDRDKKTLTIIIPKDLKENEDIKELKKDVSEKTDDVLTSFKDFFNGLLAKKEQKG